MTQLDMQNMHISISYTRGGKFMFVLSKDKQSFLYGSADYNLNCHRKITVNPHGPLSPIQASELNLGFFPPNSCLYLFHIIKNDTVLRL